MKLGLGTVQFGVDYGISNPTGKTPAEEVTKILEVARHNDISVIDTASLYGNSEEALGNALPTGHQFKLVTKTIRFDNERITLAHASLLEESFKRSLHNLRCTSIYGLLIHNADDLLSENGHILIETMLDLKKRRLVDKIGVSIYTPEHIDKILNLFELDLIQVPINVLDQRLILNGHLKKLKQAGIEIHARSIFLQGLLLMDPESLPMHFNKIRPHLIKYNGMLKKYNMSPIDAALGFVIGLDEIDQAICGVNNHLQLEEICSGLRPMPAEIFKEFALTLEDILNPTQWRL